MMKKHFLSWFIVLLPVLGLAQTEGIQEHPEKLIRYLYEQVTISPNEPPNWKNVRKLFLEEALIAMRFKKDSSAVFTVDQWIQDFDDFIERREILKTGFQEKVLSVQILEFGNIAQATVVYESSIPGGTGAHKGLDCFHLVLVDGLWKIVSLINEIPSNSRSMPVGL